MTENGSEVPTDERRELLLAAYEFARDNRMQADSSAWETTAIVWGGQTLLLGFVLEAIQIHIAQPLIVLLSVIGVLLGCFNQAIMDARTKVARTMVQICTGIENVSSMPIRPQQRLSDSYEEKVQSTWFSRVNIAFMVIWAFVGLWTVILLYREIMLKTFFQGCTNR